MDWLADAACKGKHQDLWYPPMSAKERGGNTVAAYTDIAKMVCAFCPVQAECRDLGSEETWGVWGGVAANERKDGTYTPPSRTLSPRFLHVIPDHAPDVRIDIKELTAKVKRYAEAVERS